MTNDDDLVLIYRLLHLAQIKFVFLSFRLQHELRLELDYKVSKFELICVIG